MSLKKISGLRKRDYVSEPYTKGNTDKKRRSEEMKRRIITLALAILLTISTCMTSFAGTPHGITPYVAGGRTIRTGHNEIGELRYACGEITPVPGWLWINGYCYYFTDKNRLGKCTNTVTPDGYTVDAEGRWTVNGVPQHNGYGSFVLGTDTLYAGKDDNARWLAMRGELEKLFAANIDADGIDGIAMISYDNSVQGSTGYGGNYNIIHNSANGDYISAWLPSFGNDSPDGYGNLVNETFEKSVKLIMGDHIGQEFFNAVRAAADPCVAGGTAIKYDANGNPISTKKAYTAFDGSIVYLDGYETQETATQTDGINWNLFDLNAWQGRKTDYGKTMTFELRESNSGTQWYKLVININ